MKKGGIVILDFGSQYNQLIARRVREMGVYAEVVPFHEDVDKILAREPKGIILSGGPASVYAEGAPSFGYKIISKKYPNSWTLLWYAINYSFTWRKSCKS